MKSSMRIGRRKIWRRIANLPCLERFLPFLVHHMRAFLGAHGATFAAPVMQAATALIADTTTERGLDFSAE